MHAKNILSGRGGMRALAVALTASATSMAPNVHAQGAATAQPATAEAEGQIGDIVVTAQRRVERLQQVPISAQVTSGAELRSKNLNGVVALAEMTPSVQILPQGRSSRVYVRGIGSGETQSFDQSVSTFIDGVYHGRSRLTSATFLDLERVEILKGPQSTFFGNNAIAGAINIQTKKPGKQFEADVRGLISPTSGENGGQYVAEAAVTAPLTEALRVRIAATANGQAGFARNVITGKRAPKEDNLAGRITAVYEPNSGFDMTVKGELSHNLSTPGLVGRRVDCPSPLVSQIGAAQANGLLCATALAEGLPIGLKTNKVSLSPGGYKQLDTQDALVDLNFHFDGLTLSATTGFHAYQFEFNLDNDLTGHEWLNVQAPEKYRQWSQELRVTSETDGPFEYMFGVYGQTSKLNIEQSVNFLFFPLLGGPANFGQRINANVKEDVYSAFGSFTYNATDRLKLNVGLRESVVKKDFTWALRYGFTAQQYGGIVDSAAINVPGANPSGLGVVGNVALKRKDNAFMPSARAQYQLGKDVMTYVSYSRGFKSGGFSMADVSAVPGNYGFNPEHVNAYEIGLKSELFDRHVRLNLAAFRNDFSDLQVSIAINTGGSFQNFVRNAAAARAQGLEAEIQWVVTPQFRLSAEGTYLDAKYRTYQGGEVTLDQKLAGLSVQDLSGHRTLFAPEWSGNVTGTLTLPVAEAIDFVAEGTAIMTTKYQTYTSDDFRTMQPGYVRFDARLGIEASDGRWGIDLIGKNLNNRIVRTVSAYEPFAAGPLIQDRKQLRNIALQVRYKF